MHPVGAVSVVGRRPPHSVIPTSSFSPVALCRPVASLYCSAQQTPPARPSPNIHRAGPIPNSLQSYLYNFPSANYNSHTLLEHAGKLNLKIVFIYKKFVLNFEKCFCVLRACFVCVATLKTLFIFFF